MPCGGQLILRALHIKWVQCSGLSSRLAIWNFATTCRQDILNTALNISIFLILLNININILQQLAAKIFIILISTSPSRQRESFESLDKSYTGTEVEHGKFVESFVKIWFHEEVKQAHLKHEGVTDSRVCVIQYHTRVSTMPSVFPVKTATPWDNTDRPGTDKEVKRTQKISISSSLFLETTLIMGWGRVLCRM